ncbi:MAG: aspartate carbamoyltransferase catalytic subunit [Ignavibacteria bacterium]|nr:aspartate carbamoyltransferase catalytic subunit [Ignavibacteria bacterium]
MQRFVLSHPYLLSSEDLSVEDVSLIFERTRFFENNSSKKDVYDDLKGYTVALAFFEPSTRTKFSFELATKRLGGECISFSTTSSSMTKGESLIDTLHTLEAMDVQIFIVRHSASGVPLLLQRNTSKIIVNAGDGRHEHPTQALLDSYTIFKHFGYLENLKVAIVGDLLHSRVARSNYLLLKKLGALVGLCGPGTLLPKFHNSWNVTVFSDIDKVIEWADAIILLRLQNERMASGLVPSVSEFAKFFGLTYERISRKPELVVLHPGPVNYGIELEYEVANLPNVLIQTQVTHGVYVRMALLSLLAKTYEFRRLR